MSHLGGYLKEGDPNTYLPDVWGYIALKYNIQSVLDIGCGTAHALKWFRDYRKALVLGIEGDINAIKDAVIPQDRLRQHDYTTGPLQLKNIYDLGISLEFLEHVDAKYIENFMITFKNCKYILVSHATPGQDGYHHVNCQEKQYWIDQFAKHNIKELSDETTKFVTTNNILKYPWCRGNLIFLKNENF